MLNMVSLLISPLFVWLMMEVLLGGPTTFSIEEVSFHQVINFTGKSKWFANVIRSGSGNCEGFGWKILKQIFVLFCFVAIAKCFSLGLCTSAYFR